MEVFQVVLNMTAIMLGLMALGYLLGRKKIVSERAGRDLAALELRLFLPSYLFVMLAQNVVPEKIKINMQFLLWGSVFFVALSVISLLMSRFLSGKKSWRRIFFYVMLYANFGYFGYPVIEAAFGQEVLSQYIIYVLPFTFAVNTHGAFLLSTAHGGEDDRKKKLTAKELRKLPWEVLISVVLGAVCGFSGITLPAVVYDFFGFAGACMSPVSMLLAGLILSTLPLKKLFSSPYSYYINALKLLILPIAVGSVLYFAGVRGMLLTFPVILSALPVGMNVVIFTNPDSPDYTSVAVSCFISYIFALITIPVVFLILSLI